MGLAYNTSIAKNGLILNIDAANIKSNKRNRSLINWNSWTVGTGSVSGYSINGDGNSRLLDTNPFGVSDIVWDVSNQDAASDADGGWEGSNFSIDSTKMYRFSTWVRRKTIGNGSFYLGLIGFNSAGTNEGVLNRSNGAVNTNPYLYGHRWWGSANPWYLVVGHVWPAGSGTGSSHPDSGIYDTSGNKITSITNFVWQSTNAITRHRSYLYYSTDTATNQQWYQPRVDIVDGTEPTIAELLADTGNRLYDNTRNGAHGQIVGNPIYSSDFGGNISFDATNDAILIPENSLFNTQSPTIEVWCKPNSLSQNGFLFEKGTVNTQYSLFFEGTVVKIRNNIGGSTGDLSVTSATYMNTTQWHQVAGSITNGNRRLYINGQLVNSDARAGLMNVNTNGCSIGVYGGFNGSRSYWFNGSIAIVRVYNRQLSDTEILQNYIATKSRFGK